MAITNINTLQKLAFTNSKKDLQTYSDIYLKQALANLGQRFSVKGDSVTVNRFGIWELFDQEMPDPNQINLLSQTAPLYEAYMMAVVKPRPDAGMIDNSLDYGNLDIVLTAYGLNDENGQPIYSGDNLPTVSFTTDSYVSANRDIRLPGTDVHAWDGQKIAYYGEGTIINKEKDNYRIATISYNAEGRPIDLSVNDYVSKTDLELKPVVEIHESLRVFVYNNKTWAVTVLDPEATKDKDTNADIIKYEVKLYRVDKIVTDINDRTNPLVALFGDLSKNSPLATNPRHWTVSSVIDYLFDTFPCEEVGYGEVIYNESESTHFSFDSAREDDDPKDPRTNIYPNTPAADLVEGSTLELNGELTLTFPYICEWYNGEVFFTADDNKKLKKRIVATLFSELYYNFVFQSKGAYTADIPFVLYLPYEYTFIYTCNSNRQSQIYASAKDVLVESAPEPEKELWRIRETGVEGIREQLIICSAWDIVDSTEEIYTVWKYYLTYTPNDELRDIIVERVYTLPYINDDGYWNINNVDTDVYARGKDGGQPSIIISYSDTELGKHHILSTLNKDELSTALDWQYCEYRVKPLDMSTALGDNTYHMMSTYMPINISTSYLADNMVTFLEHAIIMDVSSVHSENFYKSTTAAPLEDPSQLGDNAIITTFWALEKVEGKYQFTYVKQPATNWALDFNYLSDAEAIVKFYMAAGYEPDRYKHSWVVFDPVTGTLKNQAEGEKNKRAYPVIMNWGADTFMEMFDVENPDNPYINNANYRLAFQTGIQFTGSYITGVEPKNDEKFFKFYKEGDGPGDKTDFTYVAQSFGWPNDRGVLDKNNGLCYDYYINSSLTNTPGFIDTLIPYFDLSEVFVRGINTINRYNLITPSSEGFLYYSYFGSSFLNDNKKIVTLGTHTENISLGLDTLTKEEERKRFKEHPELDVDFDNILMNGDVIFTKGAWSRYENDGHYIYSAQIETAYIGPMPGVVEKTITIDSTDDVFEDDGENDTQTLNAIQYVTRNKTMRNLPLFRVTDTVADPIDDIGGGVSFKGKKTYVSYLNLNYLAENILELDGYNEKMLSIYANGNYREPTCKVYGDGMHLAYEYYKGTLDDYSIKDPEFVATSYYLKMTTDLADLSSYLLREEWSMAEDEENGDDIPVYYIKMNPIIFSYTVKYGDRDPDTAVLSHVNVRELATTMSTSYNMYDGGELH